MIPGCRSNSDIRRDDREGGGCLRSGRKRRGHRLRHPWKGRLALTGADTIGGCDRRRRRRRPRRHDVLRRRHRGKRRERRWRDRQRVARERRTADHVGARRRCRWLRCRCGLNGCGRHGCRRHGCQRHGCWWHGCRSDRRHLPGCCRSHGRHDCRLHDGRLHRGRCRRRLCGWRRMCGRRRQRWRLYDRGLRFRRERRRRRQCAGASRFIACVGGRRRPHRGLTRPERKVRATGGPGGVALARRVLVVP